MKVFIVTEGSINLGYGHITRCRSLYQAFREKDVSPEFVINGDKDVGCFLGDEEYRIFNWLDNGKDLFSLVQNADIVIVDSYLANFEFYKMISEMAKIPVYLDDNNRINYPRGIILNGSIGAENMKYPLKEKKVYLLGVKYVALRRVFWSTPEKEIRNEARKVMITVGGSDNENVSPQILKILIDNFPALIKHMVIGKGFRNSAEIEKLKDANTIMHYYPDAEKMKNIMLDSDIAISAAGQTLYELARIGVPTIALYVAENQLCNIKGWEKVGFVINAGSHRDTSFSSKISRGIEDIMGFDERVSFSNAGRNLVGGNGSRLIIENLLNYSMGGNGWIL